MLAEVLIMALIVLIPFLGNWSGMSEIEQKNTLRVLSKRNKERLDALKAQQAVAS